MKNFPFAAISLLLLLLCAPDSPQNEIQFSRFSALTEQTFVAYNSPDLKRKPDTLRFRFQCDGAPVASIEASILWETVQLPLEVTAFSGDTQNAEIVWIPKDDTAGLHITGRKNCVLKIEHRISQYSMFSDSFTVLGSKPVQLLRPDHDTTIAFSDTLSLRYRANFDLISKIQIFFKPENKDKWQEIVGTTTRIDDSSPIRTFETLFSAKGYSAVLPDDPEIPIRFLLRDYNSPLPDATVISDTVFLERQQ